MRQKSRQYLYKNTSSSFILKTSAFFHAKLVRTFVQRLHKSANNRHWSANNRHWTGTYEVDSMTILTSLMVDVMQVCGRLQGKIGAWGVFWKLTRVEADGVGNLFQMLDVAKENGSQVEVFLDDADNTRRVWHQRFSCQSWRDDEW